MRSELLKSARDPSSPKGVNAPSPAAETAHRVMPGRAPTPDSARRSSHEQSTGGAQPAEQILAPVRLLQIEHDGFLGLGDETFSIGLFRSHYGQERNIPIIGIGDIAAMPEEPIKTRHEADLWTAILWKCARSPD